MFMGQDSILRIIDKITKLIHNRNTIKMLIATVKVLIQKIVKIKKHKIYKGEKKPLVQDKLVTFALLSLLIYKIMNQFNEVKP